ncbi:unnamed protein product [Xylocopa violacea]|uniref:Uncharacterized protein n=1 Tax=Xylocopa violacea TaxID=135666 RepID=A0ABP1N5X3_XYLVO
MADTKYRTRSLTTLISCESYESSHDSNDTISRIIDDPHATPAQKTMRILGLTQQDVEDARIRIKERQLYKKLTEDEDELFGTTAMDTSRYFSFVPRNDLDITQTGNTEENNATEKKDAEEEIIEEEKREMSVDEVVEDEVSKNEVSKDDVPKNQTTDDEIAMNDVTINEDNNPSSVTDSEAYSSLMDQNDPSSLGNVSIENPRDSKNNPTPNPVEETDTFSDPNSPTTKREETDNAETNSTDGNNKRNPSNHWAMDVKHCGSFSRKPDENESQSSRQSRQGVEKSSSPVKLEALFHCSCTVDEYSFKENIEKCRSPQSPTMTTSTPKGSPNKVMVDSSNLNMISARQSTDNFDDANGKIEFGEGNSSPLIEKLRKMTSDLLILRNIKGKEQRLTSGLTVEDKAAQAVLKVSDRDASVFSKLHAEARRCSASVGTQNLSEIVKDLRVTKNTLVTNFRPLKTFDAEEDKLKLKIENEIPNMVSLSVVGTGPGSTQRLHLSPGRQEAKKNPTNVNLREYSFGDTNIQKFYKDSMKVFDGCYEKDFANNSELQCVLQQLNKKEWSIFPGRPGQEMLMPATFVKKQDDRGNRSTVQDFVGVPQTTNFEEINRYKIAVHPSSSKFNYEPLVSQITQSRNKRFLDDASCLPSEIRNSSCSILTKNVSTQTDNDVHQRSSSTSLKRKKMFFKRKHLSDRSRNASPVGKIEARNSALKDHSKLLARQKPSRSNDRQRKPFKLTKSSSNRSACECKMPRTESIVSELRCAAREDARRCEGKCQIQSFGTIPLSRVARSSMFDALVYRKKPPAYPKKVKNEASAQNAIPNTNSKSASSYKRLLEASKRPTDGQSAQNSNKFKWKSRMEETLEEQEAREMRALKAYNEITLLEDKKVLESKKKLPAKRNSVELTPESSRNRYNYSRKGTAGRIKKGVSGESMYDDCLDKENVSMDATTETEPLQSVAAKDSKALCTGGKSGSVSTERYITCSKLSKVNKVTDKLLENFDRLHGGPAKQDAKKSRLAAETDTRKPYTKYSKPKKLIDEENVSIVSIKKLEGTQTGRELERTPAKEDVRDSKDESVHVDSREGRTNITEPFVKNVYEAVPSTSLDGMCLKIQNGDLLRMIESITIQDVGSSCSSTTVDQGDELLQTVMRADATTVNEAQTIAKPDVEDRGTETVTVLEVEDDNRKIGKIAEVEDDKKIGIEEKEEEKVEEDKTGLEAILKIEDDSKELKIQEVEDDDKKEIETTADVEDKNKLETLLHCFETIPKIEDHRMEFATSSEIEDFETEETGEPKVPDDFDLTLSLESIRIEEPAESQIETVETRSQSLELVQNESDRVLSRPIADLIRNIGLNYFSNDLILSNTSASGGNIVDEDTITMLHNAFCYGPTDATFDLPGEILAMDDILNNRHAASTTDEFIFEPGRELMDVSMEQLPPVSRGENDFEQAIHAAIRQIQGMGENGQEEGRCDLFIANVDHEGLLFNFEVNEAEHPDANEFGLSDLLTTMNRILGNLNVRGLNLNNVAGLRFEILRDPFNDDEDEIDQVEEEIEEGDEEMEEQPIIDEMLRKFIKEDIFTNIRFPIIIKWTDLIASAWSESNEELQDFDITLNQAEPSKINLFSLVDDYNEEDEDIPEIITEECIPRKYNEVIRKTMHFGHLRNVQQPMIATVFSSNKFSSVNEYDVIANTSNEEVIATYLNEASTSDAPFTSLPSGSRRYTAIPLELIEDYETHSSEVILNKTYDLLREVEGENKIHEWKSIGGKEIVNIENNEGIIETSFNYEEDRKMYEYGEAEEDVAYLATEENTENEGNEQVQVSNNQEILESKGFDSFEVEEGKKNIESEEEISLKIIITFWLLAFAFYIRYFYQKIFSSKDVSTSTSNLKPFEVHAVPTSTSTLLENLQLLQKIEEEKEETVAEENDLSETSIVDPETVQVSHFSEYRSLNLDSTMYATSSSTAGTEFEDILKELENKFEEMYLSDRISEHGDSVSFFMSDETNFREQNPPNIEEIVSGSFRVDPDLQLQSSSPIKSPTSDNDQSNIEYRSREDAADERPLISDTEKQKLLELRLAEEEIKTFRYKDDDSSSSKSLPIHDNETNLLDDFYLFQAKVKIDGEEKRSDTKVLAHSDDRRELNSTFKIEKEESAGGQTGSPEGIVFLKQGVEEVIEEESTEQKQSSNSPEIFPTSDSFDSTYTRVSEGSKKAASIVDLNESSMEEFAIASNESIVDS